MNKPTLAALVSMMLLSAAVAVAQDTKAPPPSTTDRASASATAAELMTRMPSRGHWINAPATKTVPSVASIASRAGGCTGRSS